MATTPSPLPLNDTSSVTDAETATDLPGANSGDGGAVVAVAVATSCVLLGAGLALLYRKRRAAVLSQPQTPRSLPRPSTFAEQNPEWKRIRLAQYRNDRADTNFELPRPSESTLLPGAGQSEHEPDNGGSNEDWPRESENRLSEMDRSSSLTL